MSFWLLLLIVNSIFQNTSFLKLRIVFSLAPPRFPIKRRRIENSSSWDYESNRRFLCEPRRLFAKLRGRICLNANLRLLQI